MGDFNKYIPIQIYYQYFSKIGLRELITEKHGTEGPGYTTSNKNNNAIDGIWGYLGLEMTFGGYIPVDHGLKYYHRMS